MYLLVYGFVVVLAISQDYVYVYNIWNCFSDWQSHVVSFVCACVFSKNIHFCLSSIDINLFFFLSFVLFAPFGRRNWTAEFFSITQPHVSWHFGNCVLCRTFLVYGDNSLLAPDVFSMQLSNSLLIYCEIFGSGFRCKFATINSFLPLPERTKITWAIYKVNDSQMCKFQKQQKHFNSKNL